MARIWLQHVSGNECRHPSTGTTMRFHIEPEFRRTARTQRTHSSGQSGNGCCSGNRRALRRCEELELIVKAFTKHRGLVALLNRINIDTDQIIPKQFLKRIERTGYGPFLFYDWRFGEDGSPNPDFELNQPRFQGATIL